MSGMHRHHQGITIHPDLNPEVLVRLADPPAVAGALDDLCALVEGRGAEQGLVPIFVVVVQGHDQGGRVDDKGP
ncbi:hypothetical protein QNM99_26550 [Pseudomonas sp. PCH446]